MDRFLNFMSLDRRCKESPLILAFVWIIGLLAGILCSASASDLLLPTMRAAVSSRVSISGLLSAVLLPLLFSAFAVYISQPLLLLPVVFGKAFSFSFLALGILAAFGSAGWLVQFLLMFSDILILPLLLWYWFSLSGRPRSWALKASVMLCVAAAGIGSIDYCVISPFLAKLISF